MHNAQDPLRDTPREMCTKKKRKKEKDNAENVDTHEISPIQTYTKGLFGYHLFYSKLKTL